MRKQQGFGHVLLIVILLVVCVIGIVGFRVIRKSNEKTANDQVEIVENKNQSTSEEKTSEVPAETKTTITVPEGYVKFVSKLMNFSIHHPDTAEILPGGIGEGETSDSPWVILNPKTKGSTCCSLEIQQVLNKSKALGYDYDEELKSIFSSQGLEGVAKNSRQLNADDTNPNVVKTVSELTKSKRGNFTTYEFRVTGSYSTGFIDDKVSGTLVEGETTVIFFETDSDVVRVFGRSSSDFDKILATLDKI